MLNQRRLELTELNLTDTSTNGDYLESALTKTLDFLFSPKGSEPWIKLSVKNVSITSDKSKNNPLTINIKDTIIAAHKIKLSFIDQGIDKPTSFEGKFSNLSVDNISYEEGATSGEIHDNIITFNSLRLNNLLEDNSLLEGKGYINLKTNQIDINGTGTINNTHLNKITQIQQTIKSENYNINHEFKISENISNPKVKIIGELSIKDGGLHEKLNHFKLIFDGRIKDNKYSIQLSNINDIFEANDKLNSKIEIADQKTEFSISYQDNQSKSDAELEFDESNLLGFKIKKINMPILKWSKILSMSERLGFRELIDGKIPFFNEHTEIEVSSNSDIKTFKISKIDINNNFIDISGELQILNEILINNLIITDANGSAEGFLHFLPNNNLTGNLKFTNSGLLNIIHNNYTQSELLPTKLNGLIQIKKNTTTLVLNGDGVIQTEDGLNLVLNISHQNERNIITLKDTATNSNLLLTYSFDGKINLKGKLIDFNLTPVYFKKLIKVNIQNISSNINYDGRISELIEGSGDLSISKIKTQIEDITIDENEPLLLNISKGIIKFINCKFKAKGEQLKLEGSTSKDSGWNAYIVGDWRLENIFGTTSNLDQIAGKIKINLGIKGSFDAPKLTGDLSLASGVISIKLGDNYLDFNDMVVQSQFDGDNLKITKINGILSQGKFNGSGEIKNLLSSSSREANLKIVFKDSLIEPYPAFIINTEGDLSLKQKSNELPHIDGNIIISSAEYSSSITIYDIINQLTELLLKKSQETLSKTSKNSAIVNININGKDGIVIDTPFLQAEVFGDIRIFSTNDGLANTGELKIRDGTFRLPTHVFDLNKATIDFNNQAFLNPSLKIYGEAEVRDRNREITRINLQVLGSLFKPQVQFSSDRGLNQREIYSLLDLGSNIKTISQGSKTNKNYNFGDLINPFNNISLEARIEEITGIKTTINQRVFRNGQVGPALTAEKKLANKTIIKFNAANSEQNISQARIEYQLSPKIKFFSEVSNSTPAKEQRTGSSTIGIEYETKQPYLSFFKDNTFKRLEEENESNK